MRTLSALRLSVLIEQLRSNNEFLSGLAAHLEKKPGERPQLAAACRQQMILNNAALRKTETSVLTFPTEETTQ